MPDITDPYKNVREWWGEELNVDLAKRIVNAPQEHLYEFSLWWPGTSSNAERNLPELKPGTLRPIVAQGTSDYLNDDRPSGSHIPSVALSLLLYAHEVVVDDIGSGLTSDDPSVRRRVAEWLIKVRPLHQAGILHFRILASRKLHPATNLQYRQLLSEVLQLQDPDIELLCTHYQSRSARSDSNELRTQVTSSLLQDSTSFYNAHERVWPSKVHRLVRSQAEYAVLQWMLARSGGHSGSADLNLLQLTRLTVPLYKPRVNDLVEMRKSDEAFADLRQHLRRALERIQLQDAFDGNQLAVARRILHEEIEPIAARLEKVAKKSPVLEGMKTGTTGFGVSTIAAVTGASIGGNLASAVASAAATKTLDGILTYVRTYKERRSAQSHLDLVTSFLDVTPGGA